MNPKSYTIADVEILILKRAVPAGEEIVFDHKLPSEFELVAMYLSTLEMAWACLTLIEQKIGYHAYPILRQFLEVISNIRLLIDDTSYLGHLKLERHRSESRMYDNAKGGNPYLSKISGIDEIETLVSENQASIDELERQGFKKLSAEEKFRKAGMENEYNGLYRMLSEHTHSNFGALVSRHTRISGQKASFHAFDHGEGDKFAAVTTTLYEFLLETSLQIHERFETNHLDRQWWSNREQT